MQYYGFTAGPYKTNCYLVTHEDKAFVIDPGMHALDRVEGLLNEHQVTLEAVVLTHGHIDHTRNAGDLAQKHNCPVYIHADDEFMLEDGSGVSEESKVLFDAAHMVPIAEVRHLRDGEDLELIGLKFAIHHAPGHSPGSVLLVNEDVAFTGDVLFRGSIGRTDLPHSDPEAMDASLCGPVWSLADNLAVLPGHGMTSTMRQERGANPFLLKVGRVM